MLVIKNLKFFVFFCKNCFLWKNYLYRKSVYNKLLEEKIKNYEEYKKEKEELLKKYKTINNNNKNNTELDIDNNISEEQIKKLIKVKKINEITYYKNQEQYSFLKEVDSLALCNAKINLETAFEIFLSDSDWHFFSATL